MSSSRDSRSSLPSFLRNPIVTAIVAAVVTGLVVFVACFMVWYHAGGGVWSGKTHVERARLISQDTLRLSVLSPGCGAVPHFTVLNETEVDIQVAFRVISSPIRGGDDCLRDVELRLKKPIGSRHLIDMHTGQRVRLSTPY